MPADLAAIRRALASPRARDPLPQRDFAVRFLDHGPSLDPEHPPPGIEPRQSAVLIVLVERDEIQVVLTRRPETLAHHGGQIAFPGGGHEEGDAGPYATALRETEEELGLDRAAFEPLGELAPVWVPPSANLVHPMVAAHRGEPVYQPDPREIAEVLEVPLARFLDPAARVEEHWTLRGRPARVPLYRHREHRIWGATARMLAMLAAALRAAD